MKYQERKELAAEMKEILPEAFEFILDETERRTRKSRREILDEIKAKFKNKKERMNEL